MFKYTPKEDILVNLLRKRSQGWNFKRRMSYESDFAREQNLGYEMTNVFMTHWENTEYYSETRLNKIPVQGYLFPVEYFDVSEV